jgi:hypothetical protein
MRDDDKAAAKKLVLSKTTLKNLAVRTGVKTGIPMNYTENCTEWNCATSNCATANCATGSCSGNPNCAPTCYRCAYSGCCPYNA